MGYCTEQDLINRGWQTELIQLTDEGTGSGVINTTKLNQAISDASSTIDAYLQAKYALPITQTVEILTNICCDITRFLLFDVQAHDMAIMRYETAIRQLEQISKGQLLLGVAQVAQAQGSGVLITSNCRFDSAY
jgi:phage gp36-like protein